MKKLFLLVISVCLFLASPVVAIDKTASISWEQSCIAGCPNDAPPIGAVSGWRIYMSDTSGVYTTTPIIDMPYNGTPAPTYVSSYVLSLTGAGTKYFVVTAYNGFGETGHSIEANYPYNFALPATPVTVLFTLQAP